MRGAEGAGPRGTRRASVRLDKRPSAASPPSPWPSRGHQSIAAPCPPGARRLEPSAQTACVLAARRKQHQQKPPGMCMRDATKPRPLRRT
eukprot:4363311-Pleurochrysis_carterae.AAC.2